MAEATWQGLLEVWVSDPGDALTPQLEALFDRWGWGGAVTEQWLGPTGASTTIVKTYLPLEDEKALRQIQIGLALLDQAHQGGDRVPGLELQTRRLIESDWAEAWKAHYRVLHVGKHLVIKPTWCEYAARPDERVIEIDPGMAFGSGLHATTRLCLELLEAHVRPGARVLDVGTGSGILAIAAARLGAGQVLALDNDPMAVRVARQNVAINYLDESISVQEGTLTWPAPGAGGRDERSWDVVVANILAETIVELAPAFPACLAPGATLIVSGIIAEQAGQVVDALKQLGLPVIHRRDDGEWVALVAYA